LFRPTQGPWHTANHAPNSAQSRCVLAPDRRADHPSVVGSGRSHARLHGQSSRRSPYPRRIDELGPDRRVRLTPLGAGQYGLSIYDRNRWEPLPFEGTLNELVDVMNNDLAHWAADWSLPSSSRATNF